MKTLTILFLSVVLFSSCKKCMECETPNIQVEYCEGDYHYYELKKGARYVDKNGYEYICRDK